MTNRGESGEEGVFVAVEAADFFGDLHGDADLVAEQLVQSLEPEDLAAKEEAEVARDGLGDVVEGGNGAGRGAQFLFQRGDGLGSDAAGDDEVEEAQVGVD